jgi:hypothetical protein
MAKTVSKFYKMMYPDDDADDVVYHREEFMPPQLPEKLGRPMVVDMEAMNQFDVLLTRVGGTAEIQGRAGFAAEQVIKLRTRWAELFSFYDIDVENLPLEEIWKRLAISLAQDFVPAMRAEIVNPSDEAMEEAARTRNVVILVSDALKRRREKSPSTHVSESDALRLDFYENRKQPWPELFFGEKPDTLKAFAVRFTRDKEKAARHLLTRGILKEEIIEAFERRGLIPPAFLNEKSPLEKLRGNYSGPSA